MAKANGHSADGNKARALELAMSQIEKQYGKGSIMRLGDEGGVQEVEAISTGSLAVDAALGIGGLPKGRIVEISGPEGAGKTMLSLHAIGRAADLHAATAFSLSSNVPLIYVHPPSQNHVAEEIELVGSLSGVDIVIAGGGDDLLRNDGDTCLPEAEAVAPYPIEATDASGGTVPVITAPGGYRCIGELNVTFDTDGNVTATEGRSVGVGFDLEPDPTVQANVIEPLTEAVGLIDAEVIGASEVELDGRRSGVRTRATNEGNLMADALRATAANLADDFGIPPPDVAVQNGGGIRNDSVIPAGDITTGDTWDIAPFRNFAVVAEVPRDTFPVPLEQAVEAQAHMRANAHFGKIVLTG